MVVVNGSVCNVRRWGGVKAEWSDECALANERQGCRETEAKGGGSSWPVMVPETAQFVATRIILQTSGGVRREDRRVRELRSSSRPEPSQSARCRHAASWQDCGTVARSCATQLLPLAGKLEKDVVLCFVCGWLVVLSEGLSRGRGNVSRTFFSSTIATTEYLKPDLFKIAEVCRLANQITFE